MYLYHFSTNTHTWSAVFAKHTRTTPLTTVNNPVNNPVNKTPLTNPVNNTHDEL